VPGPEPPAPAEEAGRDGATRVQGRPPTYKAGRAGPATTVRCARIARVETVKYVATFDGTSHVVEVTGGDGRYRLTLGDDAWEVDARLTAQGIYSLLIGGVSYVADVVDHEGTCMVDVMGEAYEVLVEEQTRWIIRTRGGAAEGGSGQTVRAPLPGKITHVAVRAGDRVQAGDTLVVIEAMKMENEFKAATAGTVTEVRVQPGQAVNPGDLLVVVQPEAEGEA
jgi:biotin carboxyl carrier protein